MNTSPELPDLVYKYQYSTLLTDLVFEYQNSILQDLVYEYLYSILQDLVYEYQYSTPGSNLWIPVQYSRI